MSLALSSNLGRRRSFLLLALLALGAACSAADPKAPPPAPATNLEPTEGLAEDGGLPALDGGRGPEPGAPPLPTSSGVTIQVQPSDSGAALLGALRGAKKSIHMTMYLLSDGDVIDALGDAKRAGRDVKVLLNQSFPSSEGTNQPAFDALKKRGVEVAWAPSAYTFTHAKTILIDGEKALIMTMNLTETSARTNREYLATDTDPRDLADLEAIFAADLSNKAVALESKLVLSPSSANTLHSARAHLKQLIDSAKTSLDVEVQALSDPTIVDAIVLAHRAKVAVRVVVDAKTLSSRGQKEAVAKLKQYGVPLRGLKSPDMHAKAIVVDEALTFVGSHNMTPTALEQNREVGVLTDAKSEATKVSQVIRGDFDKASAL